jgi:hypothetical protein
VTKESEKVDEEGEEAWRKRAGWSAGTGKE